MSTFSLGISGLSAAKKHLNTVGNNIANASTVGFKRSRAEFADVYAKSGLGSAAGQTGHGVRVSNIAQQFSQGGTTFTQNSLDLAIDGNGFFVVEAGNGEISYTRAGMFGVNKEGYIVTSGGHKLQGYPANANGDGIAVGAINDLFIPQANISPNATSQLDVTFNLDSRAEPPSNYIFDPSDSDTYTHLYPSVIYDTLGNSHTMTQYFIKQPPYLPEYGEPTRAIQSLLGAARHGIDNYLDDSLYSTVGADGENIFFGDVDEDGDGDGDITTGARTLDADISKIFSDAGFNFSNNFGAGNKAASLSALNEQIVSIATTAGASTGEASNAATASNTAASTAYDTYLGANPGDYVGARAAAIAAGRTAAEGSLNAAGTPGALAAEAAIADPGNDANFTNAVETGALEGNNSDRLKAIKAALEGMIDSSEGRTQEYYEDIYKALDDYLPTVPGSVTSGVFNGALAEIESAIGGTQRAYAGIDTLVGDLRKSVMDPAILAPDTPLTAELNVGNLNPALTALDLQNAYQSIVNELETLRDANTGTEEGGVYQLALNVLQDIDQDWDTSVDSARNTMLNVLDALESEAADNRWHMHVTIDGEKVTDANENTPDYFSFNFTEFGNLDEPLKTMKIKDWVPKDGTGNQNGSDEPQIFEIDLTGTTQFAGSFGANSLSQDGFATGQLSGIDIDDAGIIIARYTNSQTRLIGQVALANFRNEQGLTPVGGTMWAESTKSGDPVVNSPGVGVAGNITSKALEDSNVDLSEELVEMIIAQRDYQANAKTLQTADTITQTIINLR